ncbi:MAG: winged helix-turn-helix domain-containing protein, partial [Candidatus Acidiferrales bacterium]
MYEFGPFRLDPSERILSRNGVVVPLTGKAFDTLLALVQRAGHLVEKGELLHAIWPDSFVEEGNLKVLISGLRKALGDDREEPKYIVTVAKHGYRFVSEVHRVSGAAFEETSAIHPNDASVAHPRQPRKSGLAIKAGVLAFGLLGG